MTNKDEQKNNGTQRELDDLQFRINRHNFSSIDVFDKNVQVKGFLRLKNFASEPQNAQVGDIAVIGGKLKICTTGGATPVWTVVGTQT